MLERQTAKPEIAAQKRVIKLAPAIGDWTTYKPPKVLVKKIKTGLYGFDRLSNDELSLVLLIHYRFIQKLLKRFKIDLKMAVELYSVQVEQTTYLNFLRTLTGPVVQSKIVIPTLHDVVSVFFSLPLANSIINYALGSHDLEPINRGLTEAENTVFATTLENYLSNYTSAFGNVIQDSSFLISSSPDVSIDSSINTSTTFVCFSAEAAFADNPPGRISIGYVGSVLKTILAKYRYKEEENLLDFSVLPPSLLSRIGVSLKVKLGNTSLSTGEINQLEIGDVVTLDTSIDSPISLGIGEALELLGQPGLSHKKSAIRIASFKKNGKVTVPPPALAKEEKLWIPETEKEPIPVKKEAPAEPFVEEAVPEEEFPEEGLAEDEFSEEFPEDEEFPEEEERRI